MKRFYATGATCITLLMLLLCVCSGLHSDEFNPYGRKLMRGVFLVASKSLLDPNFAQSVVVLIEYSSQGAVGLIVNRKTDVKMREVFPEMTHLRKKKERVYVGGPVGVDQLLILVRYDSRPDGAYSVLDQVYVVSSIEALEELLKSAEGDLVFRVYAGYAGWAPGQLDSEVARGDWHVVAADAENVFTQEPEQVWQRFIERSTAQWTRSQGALNTALIGTAEVAAANE
jgi:putative transcriptional regulator